MATLAGCNVLQSEDGGAGWSRYADWTYDSGTDFTTFEYVGVFEFEQMGAVVGEAHAPGTVAEYGLETTAITQYFLFETERGVDEAGIRRNVESGLSSNVSSSTDGRFVEAAYTQLTGDLLGSNGA